MSNDTFVSQVLYLDTIKEILTQQFDLSFVEVEEPVQGYPMYVNVKDVYVFKDLTVVEKIRWINGLLITITAKDIFGNASAQMLNVNDVNYIVNKLISLYCDKNIDLQIVPSNAENANAVFDKVDSYFKNYIN